MTKTVEFSMFCLQIFFIRKKGSGSITCMLCHIIMIVIIRLLVNVSYLLMLTCFRHTDA